MKNIKRLIVLFVLIVFTVAAILWLNSSNDKKDASKEVEALETKTPKDCEIPAFAKAIGHEDKWLLHNGCPSRKDAKKNQAK
ncbi:hypothetical protein [bacterium endosymbiont of Bathymodiolus sp. 5 South]|jgi:hypothetical protein|uniref:hypothetical protein n=1 Tax=bacterium endosymbiont of Bathymodiolus sp. 5 South TaxID=1181670 RepID=UPI0010BB205C|nr:hypothetical protein [bacterium endosymbiont of Bathymodiolus sp. 5 South]CAC9650501.1 hypothetical protein [uncultured Gammaproteobacteria bacterium]CAC9652703.1 hypothetical protein [uncultured Gammaproteobacteria bacterium]SHN90808.1 hypothetical protein BCLUESOX_1034 [bacterium endosymbiont of Bathymodiolus sp. 5 South]SSC07753.1 hypothetical protein BTURTLESOX_1009 [bacterium endosymbiont of Bathymodiolus sp. 5 South]VVH57529.1 hypothetical protein BSPCLSOX_2403 [uncultured Gammaproteo